MGRAVSFLLLLLLAACGQSGDLYLPDKPAPVDQAPAADTKEAEPKKKETP